MPTSPRHGHRAPLAGRRLVGMPSRKVVAESPQLVVPAACAKHQGAVGQVGPAVWGAIAFIVLQKQRRS